MKAPSKPNGLREDRGHTGGDPDRRGKRPRTWWAEVHRRSLPDVGNPRRDLQSDGRSAIAMSTLTNMPRASEVSGVGTHLQTVLDETSLATRRSPVV
jgi:hypothetical protein